jgi:hypothetical protein
MEEMRGNGVVVGSEIKRDQMRDGKKRDGEGTETGGVYVKRSTL